MILAPTMVSHVTQIANIRFQITSQLYVGASCIMNFFPYHFHILKLSLSQILNAFLACPNETSQRLMVTSQRTKVTYLRPKVTSVRPKVTSLGHKLTTLSPE